jgi:hypothetical protein
MILRTMPKKTKKAAPKATFIESMQCLPVKGIPQGPEWSYELKLDGYRLEAVKNAGEVTLYSRRRNVLNHKFGYIAAALKKLPDSTVLAMRSTLRPLDRRWPRRTAARRCAGLRSHRRTADRRSSETVAQGARVRWP